MPHGGPFNMNNFRFAKDKETTIKTAWALENGLSYCWDRGVWIDEWKNSKNMSTPQKLHSLQWRPF